jgi:hypothetical protein
MAARTVGPAFGYMLGSAMLTIYADPKNIPPGMTDNSPNWIGAWWIGFFIIGSNFLGLSFEFLGLLFEFLGLLFDFSNIHMSGNRTRFGALKWKWKWKEKVVIKKKDNPTL